MQTVSFDQWVEAVFDHPIREPEWYWDNDFDEHWDSLGLIDSSAVEYMARLFQDQIASMLIHWNRWHRGCGS
jgi:hypothetical protein